MEVYDWDKLNELGMGGLINVGKGSDRKPCMVLFSLNPDADSGVRGHVLWEGITFDTGGISIKPTSGMWDMKFDMCGAATVFGLMEALHSTGYDRRVNGIACLAGISWVWSIQARRRVQNIFWKNCGGLQYRRRRQECSG